MFELPRCPSKDIVLFILLLGDNIMLDDSYNKGEFAYENRLI